MTIKNTKFLIGAATAAHQVEGNNINSDFWVMENTEGSPFREPSLNAVEHYTRFSEDIELMAKAGLNAYRFSIEWARIQPEENKFDDSEIEHYKEVLECCYKHGITPIVTLHHFSSPKWLISKGGWKSNTVINYFTKYVEYVIKKIGHLMPYVCTINEANMGVQIRRLMEEYRNNIRNTNIQVGMNDDFLSKMEIYNKRIKEIFGVEEINTFLTPRNVEENRLVFECHKKAREVIKSINPDIKVGITLSLYDYKVLPGGETWIEKLQREDFIEWLPYLKDDDFIGVQNYTQKTYGEEGIIAEPSARITLMGYKFCPEALGNVIRFVSKHWDKPILITENGISTENDKDRVEFIIRALAGIYQCIEEGINVIGYIHWALLDNFEWQLGYSQKFGLIAVDRTIQKRYPKGSLYLLGDICKYGFNEL